MWPEAAGGTTSWPSRGVGISPERGERADSAVSGLGGRSERTPEPDTALLSGRPSDAGILSGAASDGLLSGAAGGAGPLSAGASDSGLLSGRADEEGRPPAGRYGAGRSARSRFTFGFGGSGGSGGASEGGGSSRGRRAKGRTLLADPHSAGPVHTDGTEPPTEVLTASVLTPGASAGSAAGSPPVPLSWEQPDVPGHNHDPHEVTVQLDGTGRRLDDRLLKHADGGASGQESDGPVFVDESGRRSRRYRRLGMVVAAACAVYAVVIVATLLSGNSNAPWLPVPGQKKDQPAGKVDTSPLPSKAVDPPAPGEAAAPGTVATAEDGTTPGPGKSPKAKASGKSKAPGASGVPEASASTTKKPKPGVSTKGPGPDPKPSNPVVDPPTSPTPTTTPPTTPPVSEPPATGGGDADGGTGAQPAGFTPSAPAPGDSSASASAAPSGV